MADIALPSHQESYWFRETPRHSYPPLADHIAVDVVVVGGGIAGLTTAYKLTQSGMTVAVIEKHELASGTTSGTTGKVTTQHGLFYADLVHSFGYKNAMLYADSYQTAMHDIEQLVATQGIDCDWTAADNYVYTDDPSRVLEFQEEARVAAALGLPASFVTETDLPFEITGAVKFTEQAKFDAVQYVRALADMIVASGSYIFEQSNVIGFQDGNPVKVYTHYGSVIAKDIVVATKVPAGPLLARVTYGGLEYPETSYIVMGKSPVRLSGMYISPDIHHYSILPVEADGSQHLLIGGGNHIPGLGNSMQRHEKLAKYGQEHFGLHDINYRWKAMDYIAYDKLPLIGKMYPWSRHMYVITGFKKWGLSTSMVAANTIRSLLHGDASPETKLFNPNRLSAPAHIPKAFMQYLRS